MKKWGVVCVREFIAEIEAPTPEEAEKIAKKKYPNEKIVGVAESGSNYLLWKKGILEDRK